MSIPDSGTAESMYFRKKHFTFSEKCDIIISAMCFPPLAQLDRVSDSDSEGHRFESCRAGHDCATIKHKRRKSLRNQGFSAFSETILITYFCAQNLIYRSTGRTRTGDKINSRFQVRFFVLIKSSTPPHGFELKLNI